MLTRANMPGLARPVRIVDRSSRATDTAFSIFSSASKRVSSITSPFPVAVARPWRPTPVATARPGVHQSGGDQRSDLLTCDRSGDIAVDEQVEHQDGHAVVHAEAEGGRVGDLQATVDDLAVADRRQQFGVG